MDPRGPAADEIRTVADRARAALESLREGLTGADSECREQAAQLGDKATELVEQLAGQIADELATDIAHQYEDQSAELRQQVEAERAALEEERATLQLERDAWIEERSEWETVRTQIEAELSQIESRLIADAQRLKEQAATSEAEADAELTAQLNQALEAQREAEQRLFEAEAQIAQLTTSLAEATDGLAAAAGAESEHATLQEKFELAIADLQTHRDHIAALEEQIATRPEGGDTDPEELAQIRQERDDLLRQLEEAAVAPDVEPSAELADLRDRFEMAVEDVRQLKNENNDLREQLAEPGAAAPGGDSNDWEAQKRRLLAELENEGDTDGPERQEERATITGTIQITDQVIAEKDREIERLQQQLETAGDDTAASDEAHDQHTAAVLDDDELVRAERERLAGLEEEWQEKLRAAELELSVERAKISRAQSELAEQQLELETLRAAASSDAPAPGESHRNWFNKLGLGGEGG